VGGHSEASANIYSTAMTSPIQRLIEARCTALGLSRRQLIHRAGYKNPAKGKRRIDELLAGDLRSARGLIERLPAALDVPADIVTAAVSETDRQMRAAAEAKCRASSKPHAIILTEHLRPTHITFAAITGADRELRIDFEPGSNRITYITEALRAVRQRSPIRFYGRAIGVIVNYSPDHAIGFDLNGDPTEVLPEAYSPGQLQVLIRGRPVSTDALAAMFSA
jgi:hypothetical protein